MALNTYYNALKQHFGDYYVDLWKQQPLLPSERYAPPAPALYVEFANIDYKPIGKKDYLKKFSVRLHFCVELYEDTQSDTSDNYSLWLSGVDEIEQRLARLRVVGFSPPLLRSMRQSMEGHYLLFEMEFETSYTFQQPTERSIIDKISIDV